MNSISVAVSFVLGLISTKIISLFLGTAGMAVIGSFRNFSTMLKSVSTIGVNNSLIKLFVENKENKKELSVVYSTFFWIFLFISVIIGCLTVLFSKSISQFLFYEETYFIPIRFFGAVLPLAVINTFWLAIYNGLEQYKNIVLIQIISNILVFSVSTILILNNNIYGGLLSIAVGELLMVFVTFLFVRRDIEDFKFNLQKIISKKYISIIKKFSAMALLSGILAPLTLLLIRNLIVSVEGIHKAGIWDAVNRLSSYYMMIFSSSLSMYYMPKLASLNTEKEFKSELKIYFKTFVPMFLALLVVIYFTKELIVKIAFTNEFSTINQLIIWQLFGDFFKIMTLAFGYQIVVKTMMKRYIIGEIVFNLVYFGLVFFLLKTESIEGVIKAYFFTNLLYFLLILLMFRKVFYTIKQSQNL
ncbi:MAG: O-antigen translocase [Bacteroidota bacterium]